MMQIPVKVFLKSLRDGYLEYKKCAISGSDEVDLAHIKGFCATIEQIVHSYGKVTEAEIKEIREPILGNISLYRKQKMINHEIIDLETPTILRRKQD